MQADRCLCCRSAPTHPTQTQQHPKLQEGSRQGNIVPFTPVHGPDAWYAKDYADPASYTYLLSRADVAELDAAVKRVKSSGLKLEVWPSSVRILYYWHVGEEGCLYKCSCYASQNGALHPPSVSAHIYPNLESISIFPLFIL